ncbi:Holliday junction branch migration protein RuvA [Verrucomicrobiota bacterium]
MITFLEGVLVEKMPTRVVLNVGGVGYEVFIPLSSYEPLPEKNEKCRLLLYDYVREDQHSLFGFVTDAERDVFVKLLSVSGIGPKLALSALSGLSVREIISSVAAGEVKRLNSISGVGKKIAERMVVELREDFSEMGSTQSATGISKALSVDENVRDAARALISLGYKTTEAKKMVAAVARAAGENMSVEVIVRKALSR